MQQMEGEYPANIDIAEGTNCLVCYEDMTRDIAVAYKAKEHSEWALATFCINCIRHLLATQYHRYIKALRTTNCAREQRALLERGPPINIADKNGFPLADKEEVYMLFDIGNGQQLSAKLDGSLVSNPFAVITHHLQRYRVLDADNNMDVQIGEERERLWQELSMFKISGDNEA
ncbi:hypothetical protein X943_003184 [Babesia divergens]|uniref:Uncharacterized protein n=1 Tax=Babesia divergens TaxID=32595 RepID=A0AAD9LG45_BABDI|nr:hypothetical protein X943_003184 [Babesia divergens]